MATKTKTKPTAIDQAKTPLLAAIGAGDFALNSVRGAVTDARSRAEERVETTRDRVSAIPDEIDELRSKLAPEELRRVAEAYVQAAASIYVSLAERGEEAVSRVRKQPQVEQAFERAEGARGDAKDLTDEVLGTVARQTRSVGERAARATERVTSRATSAAGKAGAAAAEAGDEVAHDIRSTTRKAANRTSAPKGSNTTNARTAVAKKTTAARTATSAKATTARKTTGRKAAATKTGATKTADTATGTAADAKDTAVAAQREATEATTGN